MTNSFRSIAFVAIFSINAQTALALDPAAATPTLQNVHEAMKSQLPAPPAGFAWHLHKNVIFLKPDNWIEHEMSNKVAAISHATYAASPNDFSLTKPFEMGLTIELFSDSQKLMKLQASKLMLALIKPIIDAHKKEEFLLFEQNTKGGVETIILRYRDAPQGLTPVVIHKFYLANDATDNLNVVTFEGPASTWDENWVKFGTPILNNVNMLPNVPSE